MKILLNIFKYICLLLVVLIFLSSNWLLTNYGNITVDELLFHIFVPIITAESSLINSFIIKSLIPSLIISSLFFSVSFCIIKEIKKYNYFELNIKIRHKTLSLNIGRNILLSLYILVEIFIALYIIFISMNRLHIFEYIKEQSKSSTFIEENHVNPKEINYIFPDKKRNLIYIYVESLESTYFSKEYGGGVDNNLLEPMMDLVEENMHFTNTEDLGGGALPLAGTGYLWPSKFFKRCLYIGRNTSK